MPIFSTLDADGSLECIRLIPAEALLACPHCILVASHYFDDDVCRCTDKTHYEMSKWGYLWDGYQWVTKEEGARPDAL